MNLNLTSSSADRRLKHIRLVSHVVRIFLFACMAFVGWFYAHVIYQSLYFIMSGAHSVIPIRGERFFVILDLALKLGQLAILLTWYWLLVRLFGFYAKGAFFSFEPIRCIRWAGLFCIANWTLSSVLQLAFYLNQSSSPQQPQMSSHGVPMAVKSYQMGFFDFDFGLGINLGPLIAGIVIVLIAWIMEEGHNLQEEQALTV